MATKPHRPCSHPTCSATTTSRYCAVHTEHYRRLESHRLRVKAAQRSSSVRRAVDARDQRRCQVCGSPIDTQKHHITPLSKGGIDHESNLVTLCAHHHKLAHKAVQA